MTQEPERRSIDDVVSEDGDFLPPTIDGLRKIIEIQGGVRVVSILNTEAFRPLRGGYMPQAEADEEDQA